jgi:alkanesulfonate monooxygenase
VLLSGQPHLEEAHWFGEGVLPILRDRGLLAQPPAAGGAAAPEPTAPTAAPEPVAPAPAAAPVSALAAPLPSAQL